ncbi:hypothetical protein VPHK469_0103 [Vibrio phage K469]
MIIQLPVTHFVVDDFNINGYIFEKDPYFKALTSSIDDSKLMVYIGKGDERKPLGQVVGYNHDEDASTLVLDVKPLNARLLTIKDVSPTLGVSGRFVGTLTGMQKFACERCDSFDLIE